METILLDELMDELVRTVKNAAEALLMQMPPHSIIKNELWLPEETKIKIVRTKLGNIAYRVEYDRALQFKFRTPPPAIAMALSHVCMQSLFHWEERIKGEWA